MRTKKIVAATVGLAALAAVVPATAASAHHDTRTNLTLSVKEKGGKTRTVTLKCDPARGSHPDRVDACREIKRVKGDLRKVRGHQTFAACTRIYRPVTIKAEGLARGWNVQYRETFSNYCEMTVAKGLVFDFGR
ncbi:MAG: SSI family serine proteinase inhibitor [Sporichthyaceae bacterium]